MQESYLEVTFRHGSPLAAYYYLPRKPGQTSWRTQRIEPGLIVDYDEEDHPIGIEIACPNKIRLCEFNDVLKRLAIEPISEKDFAPMLLAYR